MAACILCDVVAGSPDVPFRRLFSVLEVASEVLLDSGRFVVVADVAPVVEGHCLIVSKSHVESMAGMGLGALDELADLVAGLDALLWPAYGPCCAFEHGSGVGRGDVACIEHAHMHLAPHAGDLRSHSHYRRSFFGVSGWQSLDAIQGGLGYLFTRSSTGEYWLSIRQDVERQHWRRVLAVAGGERFCDWRLMSSSETTRTVARQRITALHDRFSGEHHMRTRRSIN